MSNTVSSRYSFVSRAKDVDFIRILSEAPANTPFILVEERDRKNQAKFWNLFIHKSVLADDRIEGLTIGPSKDPEFLNSPVFNVTEHWGYEVTQNGKTDRNYRGMADIGSIPGYVRKQVEQAKAILLPKDAKTFVTLL